MPTIWIIHREAGQRAALARIAGSADNTVMGGPDDALFASAAAPDVVLLALAEDFEVELEFAHRHARRLAASAWIVLASAPDLGEAMRTFDTLPARFLAFPPTPAELRRSIRAALRQRDTAPLSQRRERDVLTRRFARWFANLELDDLGRALDPRMAPIPVVILGERGTGRGLLARYLHTYGGAGGPFVTVDCHELLGPEDLLDQLADVAGATGGPSTIWLEDVDELPPALQGHLRGWIEFGLPGGALRAASVRWMAGAAGDPVALDSRLALALAGLQLRLPPLRTRPDRIPAFVADAAFEWGREQEGHPRTFSAEAIDVLSQHPWPGNLRELDAVLTRTLSSRSAQPILPAHLCFEGVEAPPELDPAADPTTSPFELPEAEIVVEEGPTAAQAPGEDEAEIDAALELVAADADTPEAAAPRDAARAGGDWQALVRALTHELRNPLVSIRTFSELLPERWNDSEFRERFAALVGEDVRRIDEVVSRLSHLLGQTAATGAVDTAELLDTLLDERRADVEARRLLVLKELERDRPHAKGDPQQLREVLSGLLGRALAQVPERGDLYVASRYHEDGVAGGPMLRILLRYAHAPRGEATAEGLGPDETSLELALAERVVAALGGSVTLDPSDARATVVLVDLPAASPD